MWRFKISDFWQGLQNRAAEQSLNFLTGNRIYVFSQPLFSAEESADTKQSAVRVCQWVFSWFSGIQEKTNQALEKQAMLTSQWDQFVILVYLSVQSEKEKTVQFCQKN